MLKELNVLIQTNEQRLTELEQELAHLQNEQIEIEEAYNEIETKKETKLGEEYNWFVDFQDFVFDNTRYTNFSYDQALLTKKAS